MGIAQAFFDTFPRLAPWRKGLPPNRTDTIVKFLKQMVEQDNRCTASPFFYVIRTANWYITDEDYASGDYRITYVNKDCHEDVITEEEYDKLPVDADAVPKDADVDERLSQDDYERFCENKVWREEGMFLLYWLCTRK